MKTISTRAWHRACPALLATMMLGCGDGSPASLDDDVASVSQALRAPQVQTVAVLPAANNDGLSFDRRGRLFVSNAGAFGAGGLLGTEVYRVRRSGEFEVTVDGLSGPLGSVFDRYGNLYVSNFNDGTIRKRDRHGEVTVFATLDGSGGGLAIDRRGRLYAASYTGQTIYRIDRAGEVTLFSDDPLLAGPVGLAFDRRGRLYVGNYDDAKVLRFRRNGSVSVVADLGEVAGGNIGYLTFARGCVYATSLNVNKVFAVSPRGSVDVLAGTGDFGSIDGPLTAAQFALPNGIVANRWGTRLYVSEYGSPNIRSIPISRTSCPD